MQFKLKSYEFSCALADFVLAHTELIAFQAMLKVEDVAKKMEDLAATNQQLSATTEEVSASTEQLTATMQVVNKNSVENVNKLNKLVKDGQNVENILEGMVDNIQELSGQLNRLDEINEKVKAIADQTNLLSLNAAIEAARAGEHGRGFAVVADEVRKLAGQTKDAVSNVTILTGDINDKAKITKQGAISVQNNFKGYIDESQKIADVIGENSKQFEESVEMTNAIAQSMEQQSYAIENTAKTTSDLSTSMNFGKMIKMEAEDLTQLITTYVNISNEDSLISTLSLRLSEHAKFLRDVIRLAGEGKNIANHNECAFGQWYNANKDRFGHVQEYIEIDIPHQEVHKAASLLVRNCTIENVGELVQSSKNILEKFIKLIVRVSNEEEIY